MCTKSSQKHFYVSRGRHFDPLAAACNYWRWGVSGSQENVNAICILGLNIVNDKVGGTDNNIIILIFMFDDWRPYQVFLVLWWWFLLLLLIGLVRLLYRAIQCRLSSQYDEYNDGKDFIKRGLHLTLQVGVVTIPPAHDETLSELQEVDQGWQMMN